MSCEVGSAASPPLSNSLFDEDWKMCGGDDIGGLGPIAEFNATFDFNNSQAVGGGIDPQLLSNASSPGSNFSTPLFINDNDNDNGNGNGLGNTTTGNSRPATSQHDDTAMFNTYPSPIDFNQPPSLPATPYFHSIEMPPPTTQQPTYIPSSLRHQLHHRRSVSEPPVERHYYPSQPLPQIITFHREGTPLGTPRPSTQQQRSSRNKHHPYRQHPYPKREQLRRAQTQPLAGGPTSVPMMMQQHMPPPPPQMMVQPPQRHFVSSRVCTPQPSPPQLESPIQLDPRLRSPAVPPGNGGERRERVLAIPISVEQLSAMITKAVREGFEKAVTKVEATEQRGVVGVKDDDIIETTEEDGMS